MVSEADSYIMAAVAATVGAAGVATGNRQIVRASSPGSSSAGRDSISSDDIDHAGWDESFTPSQQLAVSTVTPSLLLLKNPWPWFLFVVFLTTIGGSATGYMVATDCEKVSPTYLNTWLYRYCWCSSDAR